MKKNLMSVLILALVVVNLVLTAILTITIVPQTMKSNQLISQVCSAINLELQSGGVTDASTIPMDQIESYNFANSLTINLKDSEDGSQHIVILSVTLSMNNKAEGYKTYGGEAIESRETLMANEINTIVGQYTIEELKEDQQAVQDEILADLQKMFDSDFIVAVGFSSITFQ